MDVDERAMDILRGLFAECEAQGIKVPDDMPVDTPAHQRAACQLLGSAVNARKHGRRHWLDELER